MVPSALNAEEVVMRHRFWTITGAPLWRDWVVGVGLIGVGWAVYSPRDRVAVGLKIVLYCVGGLILLAAVGHAVTSVLRRAGGDRRGT